MVEGLGHNFQKTLDIVKCFFILYSKLYDLLEVRAWEGTADLVHC